MQGLEKAQALGAASQSFAQLRRASHSFAGASACSRNCYGYARGFPTLSTRRFPRAGTRACVRVRESSSEAWRSLSEAWRSLSDGFSSFCEKQGYLCLRNASKTRQNGLQAIFWALGRLPYVFAQKTAQNGSNRVLAGFMGSEWFLGLAKP